MSQLDFIKTPKVDNVKLLDIVSASNTAVSGTLHLTTTHLIFVDPNGAKETWILYGHIAEVEKLPITARGSSIRVKTKTFRNVTFIILRERECTDVYETIAYLSNPTKHEDLYAFHYSPKENELTQAAGWGLYDATVEFSRQGAPSELWVKTKLNKNYKLCETYPEVLYVPTSVSDDVIKMCANFRSKNRLPVLSYYHKDTQTSICRCAQPLTGFNTRCTEDEQMLQAIISSTPNTTKMYIVDTRPKINAMANRAAGKGYENMAHYDNIDFQFIGIENIHVMRQSLQKLLEIFDSTSLNMSTYLKGLDESGWLKHIKSVMDTSLFIAKAVAVEKRSVLVHCSDGWDRTAQTCSLAAIFLDPYYRTIHGFQTLIEKEWLSFGHKFVHRCGLLAYDPKEISPIFTQYLEAVWQLLNQFPTAFQFNERFLLEIHSHVYSCQFGTFLGNSERERRLLGLSERTYSLWGHMWHNLPDYINPFYQDGVHGELHPSTAPCKFKFWRSLYNRYNNDVHPRESIADYVCSLNDHNDSLKDHIKYLEKNIAALKANIEENDTELENPNSRTKNPNNYSEKLDSDPETPNTNPENPNSVDGSVGNLTVLVSDDTSNSSKALIENFNSNSNKTQNETLQNLSITRNDSLQDLSRNIDTFAIDWKPFRDVNQCSCGKPMHVLTRKYHCWNCGEVFCPQCVDLSSVLPGHYSGNKVPVCKRCFKQLRK